MKKSDNSAVHGSRWRRAGPSLLIGALIVSAVLMTEEIASPARGWLAWVSLVPLFVAIRVCTPSAAMICGALWGVTLYAFGAARGVLSPSLAPLALMGAIPAVYAGLGALLTRRVGFSPLVLGVGWIGVEFALQPLGLDCGLLATTQGSGVLNSWVGSLLGYVLVAFLVAYVNALLLALLGEVRFNTDGLRLRPRADDPPGRLVLDTTWCLPILAPHVSRPRAPPVAR